MNWNEYDRRVRIAAEHALWRGDTAQALDLRRRPRSTPASSRCGATTVRHQACGGRHKRARRPGGAGRAVGNDEAVAAELAAAAEALEAAREGAAFPEAAEVHSWVR